MNNWIKDKNNKWIRSNNDISVNDFNENFKHTENLNISNNNKAIIYLPTHNIKDVYEWYRIFNDSYAFSNNFDKFGFAIHGWFDKSRGQSIKGWFPNLYEVKASTCDDLKYYDNGISYFRSSKNFIENFNNIEELIIDGVNIYEDELILLKNQYYEELVLNSIDLTLTYNNVLYTIINPGDEQYFKIGNKVILKTTDNTFIEDEILLINYTNINSVDYAVIKIKNTYTNVLEIGDIYAGKWNEYSLKNENGIYKYVNGNIIIIDDMYDKYKTYSQIIYTYQGISNMNKEFYLRRNEIQTDINYSLYPIFGTSEELNYSVGEAYLIKCELDYSLNIDSSDLIDLQTLSSCCSCIANINLNVPNHPTGPGPYGIDTDPFRLLIMDNTVAEKVFATTTNGIGKYFLQNDITISTFNGSIFFLKIDKDGKDNFLVEFEKEKYTDNAYPIKYDFRYNLLNVTETLSVTFTEQNTILLSNVISILYDTASGLFLNNETIILNNGASGNVILSNDLGGYGIIYVEMLNDIELINGLTILGQTSSTTATINTSLSIPNTKSFQRYTRFVLTYNGMDYFPLTPLTLKSGDFIDIKLDVNIDNEYTTLLDYQFISTTRTKTSNDLEFFVYPEIDINMLNDLNSKIALGQEPGNSIELKIDLINTFGSHTGSNEDNAKSFLEQINKSVIGQNYDFSYTIDLVTSDVIFSFNGIRRLTKYKWYNMGLQFGPLNNYFFIEHSIDNNYRPYFYDYTIENYLTNYLGVNDIEFKQLASTTLNYNNIANDPNRFGIEGSNKLPNFGNIIYFGINYKEQFLDNIKNNTFINYTIPSLSYTNSIVWVDNIIWDDINNIGIITLLSYIYIPNTGVSITISIDSLTSQISAKLKLILDKKINSISDVNFQYNTNNEIVAYKPDTASYAQMMLQWGLDTSGEKTMDVYNNISSVIFKDFNEPRISFTKRDRNFTFDDNLRRSVNVATTTNIDVLNATTNIDGITLVNNNLILVKDQTVLAENGVYIFITVGSPLIRYDNFNSKNYWEIMSGTININKSYQANYELPLIYDTTDITFVQKRFRRKSDPRLTIKPIEIAKLGVNNDTQPWKKINNKYDSQEVVENLLTIQPGINSIYKIRFIDGLTEYNILNDINGQGQYKWILGENVLTENAVVGCTQTNGSGTGDLIWYTGTWVQGTWCNGIWIQGIWIDGIWVNGTFNSYPIQDFYYYVHYTPTTNNTLSIWNAGTWLNGIFNGGIAYNIIWKTGTFNYGIIYDGSWADGDFYNGIIKHIIWEKGNFYGGDFETGLWKTGLLSEIDPTKPARFGVGSNGSSALYKDRAIWLSGDFKFGEFHSGDNSQHNGSIFYAGLFQDADFYGGSFIMGLFQNSTFHNGVWFGGYNVTITDAVGYISDKILTFIPSQYDAILGLTTLSDYIPNSAHRINTYNTSFILLATPTSPTNFSNITFINQWDINFNTSYISKPITNINTITNTQILLNITNNTTTTTTYVASDPLTNTLNGNPFICAEFVGVFKGGIFLNGYFKSGIWETGSFINGYFAQGIFGINQI